MFGLFTKSTAARKYVDLIHNECGSFPNVDPGCVIELGDYGKINSETGKFEKHGNVFEDRRTKSLFDPRDSFVNDGHVLPFREIKSVGVWRRDYKAGASSSFVETAQASFGALLKFNNNRSAALFMRHAATSTMTQVDSILKAGNYDHLKNMHLVWEVVSCSSFFSYLSAQASEEIGFRFEASAPVATGVSAGGNIGGKWETDLSGGEKQIGDERPNIKYTTLFRTKKIGKKIFGQRDINSCSMDEENSDRWLNSEVPWGNLDNDGNETEDEDDDDFESDDDDEEDEDE